MGIKRALRNGNGVIVTLMLVAVTAGGVALAGGVKADRDMQTPDPEQTQSGAKADAEQPAEDTYPLDTCIVTGAKLGSMGKPVVYMHEGRELRFCCKGCVAQFEKDPEKYLKKMDEAIVEKELSAYPLETCVVTGSKLGSGDKAPVEHVYDNHLIRFSNQQCVQIFEKDPEKYLKKLDEARKMKAAEAQAEMHMMQEGMMEPMGHMSQEGHMMMGGSSETMSGKASARSYPLNTCLVSGGELGTMGEPVTYVYEGQELKFCCAGCVDAFKRDPEMYMKQLRAAEMGKAEMTEKHGSCGGH